MHDVICKHNMHVYNMQNIMFANSMQTNYANPICMTYNMPKSMCNNSVEYLQLLVLFTLVSPIRVCIFWHMLFF